MRKIVAVAALVAVFVVSATAFAQGVPTAGTTGKVAELQAGVDPSLTDETAIYNALKTALGTDAAAVTAVQTECGVPTSGSVGPNTDECLRTLAGAIARARAASAAGQKAVEDELADAEDALSASRAALKLKLGGIGKPRFTVSPEAIAQADATCESFGGPGTQARFVTSKKFECSHPAFRLKKGGNCTTDLDGKTTCSLEIEVLGAEYGRGGVVPLPDPIVIPKPESTCDGFGGAMLCYGLPVVAVVVTGFYVGHVIQSGSFSPVTVLR